MHIIFSILILVLFYMDKIINNSNISYYVITLSTKDRLENIEYHKNKLNLDITIFDGVNGDILDIENMVKQKTLCESYKNNTHNIKRMVGCYNSHINLYKKIKNRYNNTDYSLIFEDDFDIRIENFNTHIKNILHNIANTDFDIIYLGYLHDNVGEKYKDNIFHPHQTIDLLCTHAYIVNNKNIDKFLTAEMLYIDMPIDNKLNKMIKENKLKAYVIYPQLVSQKGTSIINS